MLILNLKTANGSEENANDNQKYRVKQTIHAYRKDELTERNNSIATEDLKELRGLGRDTGLINLRIFPDRRRSKSS